MRYAVDRGIRYVLFFSAMLSIFIVALIFYFTLREALPAFSAIGLEQSLGVGYPAYVRIERGLRGLGEGDFYADMEAALVAAEANVQEEVESTLKAMADAELSAEGIAERQAELQCEMKCARDLQRAVESAVEGGNEAEAREEIELALKEAARGALEIRLGRPVPAWARGPLLNGIGLKTMLTEPEWRPQAGKYGLQLMIVGSVLVTGMAIVIGVPLAVLGAIFLAEIAPPAVREVVRPAVELLAGIPSVVYGLFGMVVLVPLVSKIPVAEARPPNTGFGLLSASIVLAVMILPTITNIAEDAIRAVPRSYKQGSLALGATHWQTIVHVILPAARSGIVAAIILGVGRALGETMAMIMVIGNSVRIAQPLNNNPLTMLLSRTRTLTGNIAVEIAYAYGVQEDAIFVTGVVLFIFIMVVNSIARLLLQGKKQ